MKISPQSVCYQVELKLREDEQWEAALPLDPVLLREMLDRSVEYQKRRRVMIPDDFRAMVLTKADSLIEELTLGTPPMTTGNLREFRFKRTKNRNLFVGAGDIVGSVKEGAVDASHDRATRGQLALDIFCTPGKVSLYREVSGGRIFLKQPDRRHWERIPEALQEFKGFEGLGGSEVLIEVVEAPALLKFFLWVSPAIPQDQLSLWLRVAGEKGLCHYRKEEGKGRFSTLKGPSLVGEEERRRLLERMSN